MFNYLLLYLNIYKISIMLIKYLSVLVPLLILQTSQLEQTIVCEGNRFKHNSLYSIGRKIDLQLTFDELNKQTYRIGQVQYKQQFYRSYKINNTQMKVSINNLKQDWKIQGKNHVNFSGATAKIQYTFDWYKRQLQTESNGTGSGYVYTDSLTFIKALEINRNENNLQWKFINAPDIGISNSLTLQAFEPYKQADYQVVNQMLNSLPKNETTLKILVRNAINQKYIETLKKIVQSNNDTRPQQKQIYYTYSDYHGEIDLIYNNTMLDLRLIDKTQGGGIDFLLSQSIVNYSNFQCGEHKVPFQPQDPKIYGGFQEFISNDFFKSNLRYALQQKKFLDISLSEQNWQSHAFQFFMGDLHEVMPSTKNISSLETLSGFCKALYDKDHFMFDKASTSSYDVHINYTCSLEYDQKEILGIDILVQYEVQVDPKSDHIDFMITDISGDPLFKQIQGYEIKNKVLAEFMVSQTLSQAIYSPVIGTGYPIKPRALSKATVRNQYLLLNDASVKYVQK